MGGVGLVDPYLLNLADEIPAARRVAMLMALLQHRVNLVTGHVLALNDAYVRSQIRQHAKHDQIPAINVRCIACGCSAAIADWERCVDLTQDGRWQLWERVRQSRGALVAQFLNACEGPERAKGALEVLAYQMEQGQG